MIAVVIKNNDSDIVPSLSGSHVLKAAEKLTIARGAVANIFFLPKSVPPADTALVL